MDKTYGLAFVDGETTGLNWQLHYMWELAIVRRPDPFDRTSDEKWVFQIKLEDDPTADPYVDPTALDINGFRDRYLLGGAYAPDAMIVESPQGSNIPTHREQLNALIASLLDSTIFVGNNPEFDIDFIRNQFIGGERCSWHYRPVDVVAVAGAYLGELPPWNSRDVTRRFGVTPPAKHEVHTALADAVWVRDLYDALFAARYDATHAEANEGLPVFRRFEEGV